MKINDMGKQHNISNQVQHFCQQAFILLALLLAAVGAKAQTNYVFYNATYGYLYNDNGTLKSGNLRYDQSSAWRASGNLGTTSRNIRSYTDATKYLNASGALGNSTDSWRGDGYLQYRANRTNYYFKATSATTFTTNNSQASGNRYTYYTVTVSNTASISTNPTISGTDVITATGNTTYTASGAAYRIGYTNYRFNNADHYVDANGNSFTGTPANATLTYSWSLESNSYATVNNSGVVTVNSLPQSDVTLTLTVTATATGGTPAAPAGTTLTASKEITIQGTTPSAPIINVSGNSVTLSTEAAGTTSIRYTLDGSDPTATNGTVYNGAIDLSTSTTSPVTIKAVTIRNGNVSAVTTQVVTLTLPAPVITADAETGTATISATAGATIYYTTDGSEPTTASSQYSGSLSGLSAMTTIKAIAVKEGWNDSPVASETLTIPSGTDGGTVTLFDYEPHSWSYYSDPECPVRSLNPADVKITYNGNGKMYTSTTANPTGSLLDATGVQVSATETENTFIYYKTLERTNGNAGTGNLSYCLIPNPFSKRPKFISGGNEYYTGFYGWRISGLSSGLTISGYNEGDIIPAETTIEFITSNEYGNEVQFEAVWARAYVVTSNTTTGLNVDVSYERNFVYLASNTTIRNGALNVPVTYTTLDPATGNGTKRTITIRDNFTCAANTKFENVTFAQYNSTGQTFTANKYDLMVGRGCTGTINTVRGLSDDTDGIVKYTIRLESGTFGTFNMIDDETYTHSGTLSAKTVFGCDYDRAINDNEKLSIGANGTVYGADAYQAFSSNANRNNLTYDWLIMSGKVQANKGVADGAADNCIYMGNVGNGNDSDGNRYQGKRRLVMEGGEVCNIAGGLNNYGNNYANYIVNDGWALQIRLKGGVVRGSVFGAAAFAGASGDRLFIFTGGTIGGWVAGGANGTQNTGGELYGSTSLYMGGKTVIGSESGGTYVGGTSSYGTNGASGGNVFGAGCGILPANGNYQTGTVGRVNNSIVAVADEATIWRDVYGGGNYGWVRDNGTTGIYILGGMVNGSVYGGSNNQQGQEVAITMKGGVIKGNTIGDATKTGGLYGGSNSWGTINDNVTMNINGGQVGTSSKPANIHGGGYGAATRVSQNVDITLGASGQTTPGVTVYGDVYGGSALGYVNGETATNTYHTNVTMNKGIINGSLYGGGLGNAGNAANVYGPVAVTVNGGSVNTTSADGSGAVYGCNNINGAPQRAVAVVINGTDPAPSEGTYALDAVYGGGNRANYSYGTPTVTVNNCENSIGYVYGGGNAAHITNGNTDVTIYGGNKIGNVFGGGNGTVSAANVSGNTDVKIYGGTIGSVYGGSNTRGTIGGTINVLVNKTSSCAMHIDEVYGGGNMAPSNAGNVTIGCTGEEGEGIGDVYGGANAANITGNVSLLITGGSIERVFGGNNASGNVSGDIAVNIDWTDPSTCGYNYLGYVYGAGNKADYAGSPVVNIKNGTVSHDVFGGGLQANVGGSVTVNMLGGSVEGALYGGGALAHTNTNGGTTSVNLVGGTVHDVYGGGLGQKKDFNDATEDIEAYVNGDVTVTLNGSNETGATNDCKVTGNIFGCNNLNGSPKGDVLVNIYKTVGTDKTTGEKNNTIYDVAAVYGGGNMAAYVPSNPETTEAKATVNIYGCDDTSIQYVYGGGNAASVPASEVTVHGCYEIGYVFGGGNGKDELPNGDPNPGANVGYYTYEYNGQTGDVISGTPQPYGTGEASVNLLGGRIHSAFGGSNTKGNVRSAAVAFLDEADDLCLLHIDDVYGGGNEAYMEGNAQIKLGCITELAVIYGGSKRANVGGDIVLNITSGHFDRIFGGNNESGLINGSITVNIEETGCHPITIGELYGCGNQAPYITPTGKADPTVNVKSFTSIGRIFGGGLGEGAVVTGNPTVNINEVVGKNATYSPWEYPGKTITFNEGDVTLPEHTPGAIGVIGEVFGGGNAADVVGNTTVNIGTAETVDYVSTVETGIKVEGANILGNVYGGGNNADVSGNANVVVGRK